MADFFDSPVIRELAAILENIDPFPNPNDSDFERCRGFKKDNIGRCRIRPAQEQNQVDGLLSQFRSMTKCVDTKSLYDKMQTFITLTHCKRYHLDDALEAFDRWKAQRKAATSNSRPVTPLRSVTSHNDSFEFDSDTNSMSFTSLESSSPKYGESTLDLQIADEMKNLKITTTVQDTSSQINDNDVDEIDLQRKRFERMGDAHIPKKVKGYNHGKIYQELEKPPDAGSRPGILYVLEHTKISGLFKIGRSIFPADVRHKQNCYAIDTEVAYATDEPFFGHSRAEKIAHNILHHKRLLVVECVRCGKRHDEWFLATKDDVLSVVELTERWLKMPAYTLQDGVYKLTPKANDIHKKLFRFSMSKMNSLMDEVYNTINASRAFPNATSVGATRETGASAERAIPRILVNESPDITLSQGHKRAKSPAARTSGKRDGPLVETKEIFEMLQRRSRETTPDGDGNYITVTELEITRTIRTKVSISDLKQGSGIYDGFKPIAFDRNSKKQRGTEVKVQEMQKS